MSKRLIFLSGLMTTVLVLAACGGRAEPAPVEAPVTEAPPAEAEPVEAAPTEEAVAEAPAGAEEVVTEAPAGEATGTEPSAQESGDSLEEEMEAEEETEAEENEDEELESEHTADLGEAPAPVAGALTAQEAYEVALAQAQAWQPDAVLIEMGSSLLGPLDAGGKSESWSLSFWSPSANQLNTMLFVNGTLNGTPIPNTGFPKPVPAIESVIFDTGSIYTTAAAAGGSDYIARGYNVSAGLTSYPLDENVPTWYIHYNDPQTQAVAFTVIINAQNGEVIQALGVE